MTRIELQGKTIRVTVNEDLSLSVARRDGRPGWESSRSQVPTLARIAGVAS
jgi:hypothetical protein